MIINKRSWHYRWLAWVLPQSEMVNLSVCGYWSSLIGTLLMAPGAALIFCAIAPLVYAADKIEARCKGKSYCPWGKVTYK